LAPVQAGIGSAQRQAIYGHQMAQIDVIVALPGAKIVPGAFNRERPSVALPKGRSAAAQARLAEIVNEAKRTGIVQKAIDQAGLRGVQVAPN
jgi:polar amino acid transport system substrate-binding protein